MKQGDGVHRRLCAAMRETICTIPVNEIFEQTGGCPICRMRDTIEEKYVDYITGAAMMEPDIREITNQTGFCERHHFQILAKTGQRLPVCLTLTTHLAQIEKYLLGSADAKAVKGIEKMEKSCFVCDMIERNLARALDTLYRTYRDEAEFRALFASQEHICLPHYKRLIEEGKKTLGKQYKAFCAEANRQTAGYCRSLIGDLNNFADAFDHRNAGKPMPEASRDSLERSVEFLTSRNQKNR